MSNRKVILALAAQTCLLTGAAFGQTAPTPKTFTRSYAFLPVGLALTETAQVAVVNTAVISTVTGGPAAPTVAPLCTGSVTFLNASGAVIGTPSTFTVGSGQIAVASLPYGSAGSAGGARVEIRAEVQLTGTISATPVASAPCSLQFSLQTFDTATGVTHVYVSGGGLSPLFAVAVPFGRN